MQTVKFLVTTEKGQEEAGYAALKDGKIIFEGLSVQLIEDLKRGIIGYREKVYKPEDGIDFLRNLKYAFTGSLIRATDIKEI